MFIPKKLEFKISEAKKLLKLECCAYGCKSKPNAKKVGLCHKHYHIYRRIKDPIYDRFVNFRGNAKRREKEFTISIEQFREFCLTNDYIIKKGNRGRNCSVDRIDNNEGYHIWNIQILTMHRNLEKYHKIDKLTDDCPF